MTVTEAEATKINLEEGGITIQSEKTDAQIQSISKDAEPTKSPKNGSDDVAKELQALSVKEK